MIAAATNPHLIDQLTEADVVAWFAKQIAKHREAIPALNILNVLVAPDRDWVAVYAHSDAACGMGTSVAESVSHLRSQLGSHAALAKKKRDAAAKLIEQADALEAMAAPAPTVHMSEAVATP